MTTTMIDIDTNKELVDVATSFIPKLRERAVETEQGRRIPEETMQELKDAGLFQLLRPKLYGGLQSDMRTYTKCVAEISRGCGSRVGYLDSALFGN